MDWQILLSIAFISFWLYRTIRLIQKHTPSAKIERSENLAEELYQEVIKRENEDLESWYEQLATLEKDKSKRFTISGLSKEEVKKLVSRQEVVMEGIEILKNNYIRLKEKLKHYDSKEKINLAQDYLDYFACLSSQYYSFKQLEYSSGDTDHHIYEEIKEAQIKAEEITKRFEKKLKD